MKLLFCIIIASIFMSFADTAFPQEAKASNARPKVAVVQNPYSGSSEAQLSDGPRLLAAGGLRGVLSEAGFDLSRTSTVQLSPDEEKEYGAWNKMGMANGHLGEIVAVNQREGCLTVGLLANCNSLLGMLAGLQHSGTGRRPLKVGLVWIDAHADFNTPETSLSGMLGGMPVAVSTGLCLTRFRLKSGLDPALPASYIVMAGVRDTDPLEQELVDRCAIGMITVADIRNLSDQIQRQMDRLSKLTDLIYVHVDMDVLDPREVSGHSLTVAGGPAGAELGAALEVMFASEKAAALGIASYPAGRDEDKVTLKAAYTLVAGALRGIRRR